MCLDDANLYLHLRGYTCKSHSSKHYAPPSPGTRSPPHFTPYRLRKAYWFHANAATNVPILDLLNDNSHENRNNGRVQLIHPPNDNGLMNNVLAIDVASRAIRGQAKLWNATLPAEHQRKLRTSKYTIRTLLGNDAKTMLSLWLHVAARLTW